MSPLTTCSFDGCGLLAAGPSGCCKRHRARRYWKTGTRSTGTSQRRLTDDQAREARRMSSRFKSARDIAAHFDVSIPTIKDVLSRSGAYATKDES